MTVLSQRIHCNFVVLPLENLIVSRLVCVWVFQMLLIKHRATDRLRHWWQLLTRLASICTSIRCLTSRCFRTGLLATRLRPIQFVGVAVCAMVLLPQRQSRLFLVVTHILVVVILCSCARSVVERRTLKAHR